MTIGLMTAIFNTEFRDLPLPDGKQMAKSSTCKLVLLAIADQANDLGESAYPGMARLVLKTGLSKQGLIDTLSALRYNGLLFVADEPSKLGTNDYSINLTCFPSLQPDFEGGKATLLVKPLDQGSQVTLPGVVKPLDHIHTVTIPKPSIGQRKESIAKSVAQGILNSGKSHANGIRDWPPDIQQYGDAWTRCVELGTMQMSKGQFALCIKEFRELREREITVEHFETAYHAAVFFDGMSVTHPLGCYYAAEEIRRGVRNPDGTRKDRKTKPRPKPISADA